MPKIQTSCPNCKQPLVAEIFQVVDVKLNPRLKELLLAGGLNFAQCQICGFQGQLPVPLVYHDGDKELLLTFSPPDPAKTMEEKESALAPLLKQVTDNLAPEARKGYLFQPKAMLTMNNLVKNVLLADGITEEMLQAQQEKMRLLEKIFMVEGEQLIQEIRNNQEKIDREFFALFAEIAQQVTANRDQDTIEKIKLVQEALMEETEVGRSIKTEAEEIKSATKSLEALGNNLSRTSLLELVLSAPNHERVKAYAGLVRPAMDYEFFKLFTEKIENSESEQRKEMVERRNLLLKITQEIDDQLNERVLEAKGLLERILESESIEDALMQNSSKIDQIFIQAVSSELKSVKEKQDGEREEKLEVLLQSIQKLTTPPELEVVEALLRVAEDEGKTNELIAELNEQLLARVIEYLTAIISNYDEQISSAAPDDLEQLKETYGKLKQVFNSLLRRSMQQKMEGE